MKWFKHLSDSLNDPDIFDLIAEFGGDGYLVFFGTLEIVAKESRNFDESLTISWRFFAKNLQLSQKKAKKILEKIAKTKRFEITFCEDSFSIFIPKLKELSDNWTSRIAEKKEEKTRKLLQSNSEVTTAQEEEEEVEVEEEVRSRKELKHLCQQVVDIWNSNNYKTVRKLTDTMKRKIRARIKEEDFDMGKIIKKVNEIKDSEFISKANWFTFHWLIQNDTNYIKLLAGNYDPPKKNKYAVADEDIIPPPE